MIVDVSHVHFLLRLLALRKRVFALHADQMADAAISRALMSLISARHMLAAARARDAIRGSAARNDDTASRVCDVSTACSQVCEVMNRYSEMQARDMIERQDVCGMSDGDLDALLDNYLQSSRALLIDLVCDEWEDLRAGGAIGVSATHLVSSVYVCDYGDMQRMLADEVADVRDVLSCADRRAAREVRCVLVSRSRDGQELVPDVSWLATYGRE